MKFLGLALSAPLLTSAFVPSTPHHAPKSSTRLHDASTSAVNNVVLSPSEDPAAFDSYAIGTPRVHRYLRDANDSDEAEYVMWYHGRCQNQPSRSESAPPQHRTNRQGHLPQRPRVDQVSPRLRIRTPQPSRRVPGTQRRELMEL